MKKWSFSSTLLIVFVLLFFMTFMIEQQVQGAAKGKIAGKVTASDTGEPLSGANIIIEGTTLGAAADVNGDYFIINIPPGTYDLKASMMGYDIMRAIGVVVNVNQSTIINFALTEAVIETKAVVVVAERPVVQTDVANTQTILTGQEMVALPVAQFKDILNKQAGIREADSRGLFIRGSPQASISFTLDGIETRDNVDNQIYTRVNPDEVEQVEVITGGFNAEYGNAGAGVISVITKEGRESYSGTFDGRYGIPHRKHFGPSLKYYYDQYYFGPEFDWASKAAEIDITSPYKAFKDRPELLKELYKWRMRDEVTEYGHKPDLNLAATFGGPVPFLKNTTFFTSARREKTYYLYNGATDYFSDEGLMAKITAHIVPSLKLNLTCRYTESIGVNRYDRRLVMEQGGIVDKNDPLGGSGAERRFVYEGVEAVAWSGMGPWPYVTKMSISKRIRNLYGITLTHTLSPRTFYEINLLYSDYRIHGAPTELRDTTATITFTDPTDATYTATLKGEYALAPYGYWPFVASDPWGLEIGGTYGAFEDNRDKNLSLKATFTSQVDKHNQLNSGFHFTYIDLLKDEKRLSSDGKSSYWYWHVYPKHVAFWLTDKLEFEGMIANIGLRADCRIPHHRWFDTIHYPYDYHWSDNFASGIEGVDSTATGPYYKPPVKWVLAPRLSVSHPIGVAAKIFFNWGHYYQEPPLERQYHFMRRYDKPTYWIFGNPELPFQKTVQYEIGYEQNIMDMFRVAASGFYKDNTNLVNGDIHYIGLSKKLEDVTYVVNYESYNDNYYQSIRGLQFTIEKRVGKFWTGWFNYDYEIYSRGRMGFKTFFENPTRTPVAFTYSSENKSMVPMPRLNVGVDLHLPSQFGPNIGGFYPLADINLNVLFWWRSQPTFTYNPGNLRSPYEPRDNKRWKAHHATNLVFTKRFSTGVRVTPIFYVEVYNLFNTKNMFIGALNEGQLKEYCELLEEHGGKPGERGDLAMKVIGNNPAVDGPSGTPFKLYLNPREIWLGFRLELK